MRFVNSIQRSGWAVVLLLGFWACKPEAELVVPQETLPTTTPAVTQSGSVNAWILSNMKDFYYWTSKMPASPDTTLAPAAFFKSLLYSFDANQRPDGDRFSWVQENASELSASLSGETTTTGMEYALYLRSAGSDAIIAQVLYVLPNSPAARAGMKRGDIITKVNNQGLTRNNYSGLLNNRTTFSFGLGSVNGTSIADTDQTRSVTVTVYQENPVYLDSIYSVGGKTVGYLVYNQFNPGANGSNAKEYDAQLDAIFQNFKNKGVNELVLDLRYNPGGYTSSSTNLASLIGRGVDNSKLFFREEWNEQLTPHLRKEYGEDFFQEKFINKSQGIGNNLQRVFVLTTDWTASASELIINGLKPYMTVVTIGTTTYGKNVGSITLSDETGKIKWGMQPIVFKSYNSLGQSDYAAGFKPAIELEEPLQLMPLGDTREAFLGEALRQIAGGTTARRIAPEKNPLTNVGVSLQRKAGNSNMFKPNVDLRR
ncbi:S41 family peptidase [Telluribacter sp.]|jgi:C-terminal processing protease CtpA/Prc|uniref:S41 family peptidase n=1 Tax=Telluribacter sp. TaxID=1978767 RepID=UPI002E0DBC7D|nr:S41 family peptidase [Telluribacter sp.]